MSRSHGRVGPLANAIVPLDRESMGRGTLGALEGSPGSSQAIGT